MLTSQAKKLTRSELFLYWIEERELIRRKKEAGKPKPWTDDEILRSYRFCNVRRMDDKVSLWLLKNWYEPYYDHQNILLACSLGRFFNQPSTLERIDFPVDWNPDQVVEELKTIAKSGRTIFNPAYIISGNSHGYSSKYEGVVRVVIDQVKDLDLNTKKMGVVCGQLMELVGFGSFMSGQVVADLRWAKKGLWSDRFTWAPIGPGSRRGMNLLQGRDVNYPLKQTQFIGELRTVFELVRDRLPTIAHRLELHDIQNCLCEFSKYKRTLDGAGKPKQFYNGRK